MHQSNTCQVHYGSEYLEKYNDSVGPSVGPKAYGNFSQAMYNILPAKCFFFLQKNLVQKILRNLPTKEFGVYLDVFDFSDNVLHGVTNTFYDAQIWGLVWEWLNSKLR